MGVSQAITEESRCRAARYSTLLRLFQGSYARADRAWAAVSDIVEFREFCLAASRTGVVSEDSVRRAFQRATTDFMDRLAETDQVVERGTPSYPDRLAVTQDAPPFLFVRGNLELLGRPSIAIVGTRSPSPDGVARAYKLAHLLTKRGIVVVSGLAKGIDTAAHRGALDFGGPTVAVIGTPLDRAYPQENGWLQQAIAQDGVVVSQFAPGTRTERFFFPMRNATMSGLSLATVVIEASDTSGALIQARKSLAQGRKLFIPRSALERESISWPKTYACRPGAHVFDSVDSLMDVLAGEGLLGQDEPEIPTVSGSFIDVCRG